jgi:uncharacterized cupredoxin-like copper-binding protein
MWIVLMVVAVWISGCASSAASKEPGPLEVTIKEYEINEGSIQISLDDLSSEKFVKVKVINKGTSAHNLVIEELQIDSGVIRPGQSVILELNPEQADRVYAKCTLPGHEESGMRAQIIVDK